MNKTYESLCEIMYQSTCLPTEDWDQPAHSLSLIRVFAGHSKDSQVSLGRPKTDQTLAVQACLSLSAHVGRYTFSCCMAHIEVDRKTVASQMFFFSPILNLLTMKVL